MRGHVRKLPPSAAGEQRFQLVVHTTDDYRSRVVRGTRADADAALRQLIAELEKGRAAAGSFGELIERWMSRAHANGRRSTNVTTTDKQLLAKHSAAITGLPLRKVTARRLEDHYDDLRANGCGARTVQRIHGIFVAAWRQGVRWGEVTSDLLDRVTPPPAPKRALRAVHVEVFRDVTTDIEGRLPDVAAMIQVAAFTGMRVAELCGLQWADVDLDAGVVSVRRTIVIEPGSALVVKDGTKTGRGRRVAASAACLAVLEAHRDRMTARAKQAGQGLGPWVFSTDVAGRAPARPDWPGRALRRWSVKDGRKVTMHGLRHTYATLALAGGAPLREVSDQLGHSRMSTTSDIYAEAIPGAGHSTAEVVARLLAPKPSEGEPTTKGL
jgi:integrase